MSILSKLTVKPLLWVIAALLVLLVLQWGVNKAAVASARASVADARAAVATADAQLTVTGKALADALQANLTNNASIDQLQQRLDEAVGRRQQVQQALANAEAERDAARSARNAASAALKTDREKTYATDQSCAAWGARPVCGAISNGLQQQWERAGRPAASGDARR